MKCVKRVGGMEMICMKLKGNKKAQGYLPQESPYSKVSPILIIGIGIFYYIIFLMDYGDLKFQNFVAGIGIVVIIIGAVLSLFKVLDN